MCNTCGCSEGAAPRMTDLTTGRIFNLSGHQELHAHEEAHAHDHGDRAHSESKTIELQEALLKKNNQLAERNRALLQRHQIVLLNLLSAPGSGKTTLLERTILSAKDELTIQVIEGDQETANDAERIRKTGARVVQINTGVGCHLEADMVARAIEQLAPPDRSMVMIENVGNLVCPALFDLGERAKVVILSVTEGEDKPVKYPHMFRAAQVLLLNKIDLLPHLSFDVERCLDSAKRVNPQLEIFSISALSGEGMQGWYAWLRKLL